MTYLQILSSPTRLLEFSLLTLVLCATATPTQAQLVQVGTAAVNIEADDSMVIAGGIGPGRATGQEGELRAVAVVVQSQNDETMAVVACDVLFTPRDLVDQAVREIERTTGIPSSHIMVHATHTHHAPSTIQIHGCRREEVFCRRLVAAVVQSVQQAHSQLDEMACEFLFHMGEEKTVGSNSRLLLADGKIHWVGSRADAVRPTGPFDPELPVLAFRRPDGKLQTLIYNHSTHTIGTRRPGVRSPSFYGLAAQELETELGGTVCFLEGASGSTHNITGVSTEEAIERMKVAVRAALNKAAPRPVTTIHVEKRPFTFRVRTFDENTEDQKVTSYVRKYAPSFADRTIDIFRDMRRQLKSRQGDVVETSIQAIVMGDVALVGVPAEYFTGLGVDIKTRSPFADTVIAELANDWIGYLPDREAHQLGGYQTWMGLHSYAEPGTGERMADAVVDMLQSLRDEQQAK